MRSVNLAVLSLCVTLVAGCVSRETLPPEARRDADNRGRDLFRIAMDHQGSTLQSRLSATAELARRKESEKWLILLLTDGFPMKDEEGRFLSPEFLVNYEGRIAPIVATALENIPADAGDELLWAVTSRLSDRESAIYGLKTSTSNFSEEFSSYCTDPIRDIARRTLARSLAKDHDYDVEAWRRAISARDK